MLTWVKKCPLKTKKVLQDKICSK